MNFKEDIKKTIVLSGEKVEVFSNNKCFVGYCLFNKISKNLEEYYEVEEPEEIGQTLKCYYSVWLVSDEKFSKIDYITHKNEKFEKLYEKFREETGCFELVVLKRSWKIESIWSFKKHN